MGSVPILVVTEVHDAERLWDLAPHAMAQAMAEHDSRLRELAATNGGAEVRTPYDGFVFLFRDASRAVRFCFAAGRALSTAKAFALSSPSVEAEQDTGELRLTLRLGAHVAGPTAVTAHAPAFVQRAVRVARAAHGEQI